MEECFWSHKIGKWYFQYTKKYIFQILHVRSGGAKIWFKRCLKSNLKKGGGMTKQEKQTRKEALTRIDQTRVKPVWEPINVNPTYYLHPVFGEIPFESLILWRSRGVGDRRRK